MHVRLRDNRSTIIAKGCFTSSSDKDNLQETACTDQDKHEGHIIQLLFSWGSIWHFYNPISTLNNKKRKSNPYQYIRVVQVWFQLLGQCPDQGFCFSIYCEIRNPAVGLKYIDIMSPRCFTAVCQAKLFSLLIQGSANPVLPHNILMHSCSNTTWGPELQTHLSLWESVANSSVRKVATASPDCSLKELMQENWVASEYFSIG